MDGRAKLRETLELQLYGFQAAGVAACRFYARLCELFIADVDRGGRVWQVLEPHALEDFDKAYALRLLGAFHRMALNGDSRDLAGHFPSTGGDGDAVAAHEVITALLSDPPALVTEMLTRPPQTNEVGRSIALASGLLVIAERLGLPIQLREIGSSAGLNLRLDSYWYEQDGQSWGNPDSSVRFVDKWAEVAPPWDAELSIVDRRACDSHPIDVTDPDGASMLLSYVWPEPAERFDAARAAIDQAANFPVTIDEEDAGAWLPRVLAEREPGRATVVMHSVMWQYLSEDARKACTEAIEKAGAAATAASPVAWLRLEPHPEAYFPGELRARVWDGSTAEDLFVACTGFHGGSLSAPP